MIVTGSIFDAVRQFLSFVFRSVASLLQVFPKKQSYLLLLKQTFEKLSNIKERHSVFMILLPISGAFKNFCLKSVVFIEAEVNQKFDAKLYLTFATYFCFCYVMIIGEISETDLFFIFLYNMIPLQTRILKKQTFVTQSKIIHLWLCGQPSCEVPFSSVITCINVEKYQLKLKLTDCESKRLSDLSSIVIFLRC